jgi:hypothetical protein
LTILEKQVKHWVQISAFLGLVAGIGVGCPGVSLSQTPAPATAVRDGQHDFDFNFGRADELYRPGGS